MEELYSNAHAEGDIVWRGLNKLLNRDSGHVELDVTENQKQFKGAELANHFNEHFTNLTISVHDTGRLNFMAAPNGNRAFFEPTTPDEVDSAFICLKNSSARDIDGLQIKPIKFAIDV